MEHPDHQALYENAMLQLEQAGKELQQKHLWCQVLQQQLEEQAAEIFALGQQADALKERAKPFMKP